MTKRYEQLVTLINRHRPRRIVEVGVHRGLRAAMMTAAAARHGGPIYYTGFDVFETRDQAFHDAALNGKGIAAEAEARNRLSRVPGVEFRFVVGDTRETLHGTSLEADFAFIDGDHRVDVIRRDAAAIMAPVLVFDDYYREPGGRPDLPVPQVDLEVHGANRVVAEYAERGHKVEILPVGDLCKHGARAYLAVVHL